MKQTTRLQELTKMDRKLEGTMNKLWNITYNKEYGKKSIEKALETLMEAQEILKQDGRKTEGKEIKGLIKMVKEWQTFRRNYEMDIKEWDKIEGRRARERRKVAKEFTEIWWKINNEMMKLT